jgi:GNAT superfamily N-acetyltransferase
MTDNRALLRRRARLLLDLSAPRDALAVYYALHHDPERTELIIEEDAGRVMGFLAVCQTGRDLFRKLAVLRARAPTAARALLHRGLHVGRPYYLLTTLELHGPVEQTMEIERAEIHRIYRMRLSRYAPRINVLVTPITAPDGSRRFVIRSQGEIAAESGVNWHSPHFAEVYVWAAPQSRGRGWGRAVLESCISWVFQSGAQPVYVVAEDNEASIQLAESVGFVDTHARELAVEGTMRSAEGPLDGA